MTLARRMASWSGWPLVVAGDALLSAIAVALGYEWSRLALVMMLVTSAVGWTLAWAIAWAHNEVRP